MAALAGFVKGLKWKGNEGSNPLSAYNVMSPPRLMEPIWKEGSMERKEGGSSGLEAVGRKAELEDWEVI